MQYGLKYYSNPFFFQLQNYIVQSILPIREVEKEGFRELIASLIGELVIKGRTFFTEKLEREHSQVHTNLMMALELAKWISTTADMWTAHGRSFLGIKVSCSSYLERTS